jgi:hypothetical protein
MADGISVAPWGSVVRATWAIRDGEVGRVQFDDDAGIPLFVDGTGWGGQYPVLGRDTDGVEAVILQGTTPDSVKQEGTLLVRRDGRIVRSAPHGGVWPLWLTPTGQIHRSPPAAGSQGFAWVENDGAEVYADVVRATYWAPANLAKGRPDPVVLLGPCTRAEWDWIIGQDTTPGTERIIAYRISTDDLFVVVNGQNPVLPKGAQHPDGTFTAAICFLGTVHSSQFTTWRLPDVLPPDRPLEPIPTTPIDHPVWVGPDNARPDDLGNCTWSPTEDGRQFFEGADWLPSDAMCRTQLLGLLFMAKEWSLEDPSGGKVERLFLETVKAALRYRVPVVVCWDAKSYMENHAGRSGVDWCLRFLAEGCWIIRGIRCYPGDLTEAAIRESIRSVLLITPVYAPYGYEATELAQVEADHLMMAYPEKVVGKLAYGQIRGTMWPRLRRYWQTQSFPMGPGPSLVPTSQIPSPSEPPAVPPTRPPGKSSGKAGTTDKVGGLIAVLAAMWGFFRRRKP